MILGHFLPALMLVLAAFEVPLFLKWRSSHRIEDGAANIMILASLLLPLIVYVVLNIVLPDVGAIEVF